MPEKLGSLTLEVENIALTERKQRHKLAIILKTVSQLLQLEEHELKWSVDGMYSCETQRRCHVCVRVHVYSPFLVSKSSN